MIDVNNHVRFAFSFLALLFSWNASAELKVELSVDGKKSNTVAPAKAMEWRIRIVDEASGKALVRFQRHHMKAMHLVVVKEDLSHIAHIHPTLIGNTGVFSIVVNQRSSDPDNKDTASVIPEPGRYFLIAEVVPDRGALLPLPEVIKTTLTTEEKGELLPLKKDRLNSAGKYVKYIDEKGRIAKYGALFEVKLRVETVQGCAGNLIHLIYEVYQWDSEEETYLPVTQFQPWLMMTGHVLLMSANEAEINEKTFAHLHFMKSPGQRELIFDYFDRKKLSGKTVKAWLQFKVDEKVQKVPFTFDYTSSYRATCD